MPSTDTLSYNRVAKALHWLIALLVLCMLALGLSFQFMPRDTVGFYVGIHKATGMLVLALSLVRLLWRLFHRAPPLPATMPRWEQIAAQAGHAALYFFMIAMPLTGWAMTSASPAPHPISFYGLFDVPLLPLPRDGGLAHGFNQLHNNFAYIFLALIAGHAAAALRHHFILKDGILLRMAPRGLHGALERLRGR